MTKTQTITRLLAAPIAHRGLHLGQNPPENSLAAFALAIEHGLPIELDVYLLADGKVVVFHDGNLLRMTGHSAPVTEMTTTDLKDLRLAGTDEGVPLLEDVLDLVQGRVPLLIEIKTDAPQAGLLESAVLALVSQYSGDFAIQSFNLTTVEWFRDNAPSVTRGYLSLTAIEKPSEESGLPDFFACNLGSLQPRTAMTAKGDTPLIAWTVRTVEEQARSLEVADNYIFDASAVLLAYIRSTAGHVTD